MLYLDVDADLPFRPEVVWAQLTNPETYELWFDGLREVEPMAPIAPGSEVTLSLELGARAARRLRKMSFDVTAFVTPKERPGLLAFEGRLVPEGLVLGSVRVTANSSGTNLSLSLEIAQGHAIREMFDRPFGLLGSQREEGLRRSFERGLVSFRKALEARAADPYRGRT